MSSLRKGHTNLLCIVPISSNDLRNVSYVPPRQHKTTQCNACTRTQRSGPAPAWPKLRPTAALRRVAPPQATAGARARAAERCAHCTAPRCGTLSLRTPSAQGNGRTTCAPPWRPTPPDAGATPQRANGGMATATATYVLNSDAVVAARGIRVVSHNVCWRAPKPPTRTRADPMQELPCSLRPGHDENAATLTHEASTKFMPPHTAANIRQSK